MISLLKFMVWLHPEHTWLKEHLHTHTEEGITECCEIEKSISISVSLSCSYFEVRENSKEAISASLVLPVFLRRLLLLAVGGWLLQ